MADMKAFRDEIDRWAAGGPNGPGGPGDSNGPGDSGGTARGLAAALGLRTAVLLEGPSDVAAVEALAARHGRDLAAEGVCVVSMGGAMNVARYAGLLGPPGLGLRLTGLCDEGERGFYARGLERAGAPSGGFFVCAADLEDELVRALGPERAEEVVRAEGDLRAWQTFLNQPAQHGRSRQRQLRRFLGTKKGRKIRYGRLLVEALDTERVPSPLADLLRSL
ncbi:TOPRIM nucleotidyl transferase/hydrolase domain-containing protein [Streptomyces cinereoruber]|uniref:TOPRIM nucleotidyl transferase/hydrolase domain-containing protein n=1 Tax=Streptomyces cinereoruber TaxID=67260 RepID=UPI003BF4837E